MELQTEAIYMEVNNDTDVNSPPFKFKDGPHPLISGRTRNFHFKRNACFNPITIPMDKIKKDV